jgi:hypothetical protein
LAFVAGGSVVGLGSQRVKDLTEHIHVALTDFIEIEIYMELLLYDYYQEFHLP